MQLIRGLHNLKLGFAEGSVVTVGNYDGLHLGHKQVLNLVKKKSQELELPPVVIIFEPQPEEFFTENRTLRLTNLRVKLLFLAEQGIDTVLLIAFNKHFAGFTAEKFVHEVLVKRLHVKYLVIGDDFVFGHNRLGGYSLLAKEAALHSFHVTQISSYRVDGVRVSSTLIRAALLDGNLELATRLLGRPYRISGKVVHGDRIGGNLGFPTANIYLKNDEPSLLGVYAVKIYGLTKSPLSGIINIGFRPTVVGKHKSFEVHIFDFNENVYGRTVIIEFCKKIRDERKFNSLAELKLQIGKDIQAINI